MPLVPPLAVMVVAAALLAVRRVRGRTFPGWAVALAGALVVVATGGIPPEEAVAAVDWNVLATLGALFVVGAGRSRVGSAQASYRGIARQRFVRRHLALASAFCSTACSVLRSGCGTERRTRRRRPEFAGCAAAPDRVESTGQSRGLATDGVSRATHFAIKAWKSGCAAVVGIL